MNYTLMSSLEHRALVRIAIILWNQDDARDLLSKFYLSSSDLSDIEVHSKWQAKDEVIKKVMTVPLLIPELLKKKLLSILVAVGWQILMWQEYHKDLLNTYFLIENIRKLCWTPEGTVDTKKTAEILVGNEGLDITTRYRLACTYCLEDDIYTLWEQLSGTELYGKDLSMIRRHEPRLVSFWSHYIEGEIEKLDDLMKRYCESDNNINPYEYAFQYSAKSANKAATRDFLHKLTPEEKERILVRTAVYVAETAFYERHYPEPYADVFCFLLSAMDKEQQAQVFKNYSCPVLKSFMHWPWQRFFMETAKHMWTFITKDDYDCLLLDIINKVMKGCKDYNYQDLFGEFWQQSPTTHKRRVIEACDDSLILTQLFWIKDEKNIKLILKDATLIQKKNLIFCNNGKNICKHLNDTDQWDLLKFFIQECISSKNEMIKFKDEFKEHITQYHSQFAWIEYNYDNFFYY